jgi:hypothetical protein
LEGTWIAKGHYYDENNNIIPVEGGTTITHRDKIWVNEGHMKLLLDNPIELHNRYEIVPFKKDFTSWRSYNPALGTLIGKFMVVEDTIISTYITENGEYSGSECIIQISDTLYVTKGFAFKGDSKLSSWSVKLSMVK